MEGVFGDELSLFRPSAQPAAPLRCIIYCEFDPHLGPRVAFQSPPGYVPADVCDALSDHLLSSPDLCGRLVSVAAFGLRFVGHPELLLNSHYQRNQLIFNTCLVFEAGTDASAYAPLVSKLATNLRHIETEHSFLTSPATRDLTQQLLDGIRHDLTVHGELRSPPHGCDFLPPGSQLASEGAKLKENLLPAVPETIQQHEVPVLLASSSLLGSLTNSVPILPKLLPLLDRSYTIKEIAQMAQLEVEEVIGAVRQLMFHGMVRTIDQINFNNVYVPSWRITEFIKNSQMMAQFCAYCRPEGGVGGGDASSARMMIDLLLALQPGRTLAQVCCDKGLCNSQGCTPGKCTATSLPKAHVDIRRMITFARVKRYLRLIEHYPVYTGTPQQFAAMTPGPAGSHTARVLALCDGTNALDSIACQLNLNLSQVQEEVEGRTDVIIINQMSPAGSTVENP